MANITRNTPRLFHGDTPAGSLRSAAAAANTKYWEGAALMRLSTGIASCTPTASGKFAGFCAMERDNSTGSIYGGTAGSTQIEYYSEGVVMLSVARAAGNWARDSEETVYASDDDTFTTDAGTNNIVIGKVAFVPEAAVGLGTAQVVGVAFESSADRSV